MRQPLLHPASVIRNVVSAGTFPRLRVTYGNNGWAMKFSTIAFEDDTLMADLEKWRLVLDSISAPWRVFSVDFSVVLSGTSPSSFERFGGLVTEFFSELRSCRPQEMAAFEDEPIMLSLGGIPNAEISFGYGDGLSRLYEDGPVLHVLKKYEDEFLNLDWSDFPLTIELRLNGR